MAYGASTGKSAATGYSDFYKNSSNTAPTNSDSISGNNTTDNSNDSMVVKARKAAIKRRLMAKAGS